MILAAAQRCAVEIELPYRPLGQVAHALIGRQPGVAFLDGGGPSRQARWSYLGWRPRRVVTWPQGEPGALDRLRACLDPGAPVEPPDHGSVPFRGGWIGWFSYDLGRHFERLPARAAADASIPDFVLGEYDLVLAEDRAQRRLFAAGWHDSDGDHDALARRADAALAATRDAEAAGELDGERAVGPDRIAGGGAAPEALVSRAEYLNAVERVLEHIRAGDIYQANYSHRFVAHTDERSAALYARLRAASPAPFGCYLGLPGGPEILSTSPELFLRKTGRRLETRPIKGTRPRGAGAAEDARLRAELRDSPKERAELLMITDLLRNDLGRVATYGSVRVPNLRELEAHPTVHHAYSVIEAELREGSGIADVIAATLPGGSVTGAPKIRAMEILDGLEPLRRGPYTGAAGYIGHDGSMCLNILIRTIVRQREEVWYQVGGGIVADSDPEAEYEETLAKGAALRRVLTGRH